MSGVFRKSNMTYDARNSTGFETRNIRLFSTDQKELDIKPKDIGGKVKHKLRVASYNFRYASYEFKSTSYKFKCTY